MGIRGLQSFLERVVPGGCSELSIEEKADAHRAQCPPGTRPTIVVDGLSLISWIFKQTDDYIFGGPWRNLCTVVERFVHRFDAADIDLVFIFDGCVSGVKTDEWVKRRWLRIEEIDQLFQKLHSRSWTPESDGDYKCPSGTGYSFSFAVKFLTPCKVLRSVEDCDLEVARYAENHAECFAILTQDSDFAVFDLHVLYLSVAHLDLERMTTCAYHGQSLAKHLGLDRKALPLFACLAGNDSISREQHLASFHESLGYPVHQRRRLNACFEKLAEVMRKKGWAEEPDARVAENTGVPLYLLQSGVAQYDLRQPPLSLQAPAGIDAEAWSTVLKAYKDLTVFPGLLQILYGRELFLREATEEMMGPAVPPSYSCFRPIRRRMYWVLFGGRHPVEVTEHTAYPAGLGVRHERVCSTAFGFKGRIPTLHELWCGQNNLTDVRWQLFYGCLGVTFGLSDLASIPVWLIHLCCTIHIMLAAGVMHAWEAMAFLAQALVPRQKWEHCSKTTIPPSHIHPRAVNLATYFMVGVQAVTMALSTCGHPFPLEEAVPWLYFDGKVFHIVYRELQAGNGIDSILEYDAQCLKEFYRLWHIISTSH